MSIKIVTDSTCDLPPGIVADMGITVVPCYLNFGDESYLDGVEISRQQFYRRLKNDHTHPTTSSPNLQTFIKTYRDLIASGASEIISIHIPQKFSSTLNVAKQAARSFKSIKITVFDSGQLSLGTGFMAMAASKAISLGKSSEEIIKILFNMVKNTYTFAVLDTLDFLRRSGRLSNLTYKMGALLDIKPLITLHNGEIKLDIIRTNNKALNRLLTRIKSLGNLDQLAILHLNAPEKAAGLCEEIDKYISNSIEYLIEEATPVLGVHLGPGAVGTVCVRSD